MHRNAYENLARLACLAWGASAIVLTAIPSSHAATLDRIRDTGKITLGYETDAKPFSFDDQGKPAGYSVALCERVVDEVKRELSKPDLQVAWIPVKLDERLSALQDKKVDLLCGADSVTLKRRIAVGFSLPIFSSGIGALIRKDAPLSLRTILAYGKPQSHPIWRGDPARTVLGEKTFSVVKGTRSEKWLQERLDTFQLSAKILPVESYEDGARSVEDGRANVFFGDLPILLATALEKESAGDLIVINRRFTYEPIALSFERGDEDFRLTVDRALSNFYATPEFRELASKWFGGFAPELEDFAAETALPQ